MQIPTPGELKSAISDANKKESEVIGGEIVKDLRNAIAAGRDAKLEWGRTIECVISILCNLFHESGWALSAEHTRVSVDQRDRGTGERTVFTVKAAAK